MSPTLLPVLTGEPIANTFAGAGVKRFSIKGMICGQAKHTISTNITNDVEFNKKGESNPLNLMTTPDEHTMMGITSHTHRLDECI